MVRDYLSDLNGLISNASPVIEVLDAENITISNLTVDGSRAENIFADGCNSAGVMIMRSEKIVVGNIHLKDYNGEGISWQITENATIKNCDISGNGNTGLHLGIGSPFTVIENNDVHHYEVDGLFICRRVYQSKVISNKFYHNGRYGICTGHKDTDVVFDGNHIYNNAGDGINIRGISDNNAPHRNTFVKYIIENNIGYGFSIKSQAKDLLLKENIFKNSAKKHKAAIYIHQGGIEPKLENNQFDEHELGEIVFEVK